LPDGSGAAIIGDGGRRLEAFFEVTVY